MALSTYGRNFYSALHVGLESTPPSMFLALCLAVPEAGDSGSTITEAPTPRLLLLPGSGNWSSPTAGVSTYAHEFVIQITEADEWGTIEGYAICDSLTTGTGNMLFYGNISPSILVDGFNAYITLSGIQAEVA